MAGTNAGSQDATPTPPEPQPAGSPAPSPPAATSGGGAAPAKSPKTILDELNTKLEEASAAASESREASDALKADIDALRKAYEGVGKAVEDYGKGHPSLQQQLSERKTYIDGKRPLIENAIDDRKDEADKAWDDFRKRLQDLEQQRQQQWDQLVQAQEDLRHKQQARDQANDAFEALKGRQAAIADRLKKLGDLKTYIEAAEDRNAADAMYVALREYDLQWRRASDDLKEVDAYRAELEAAWATLNERDAAVREAAQKRSHAQNAFDLTKAELERLRANRVEEILKLLVTTPTSASGRPSGAAA
jgi:chromosome segregation ATPase